MDTKKRAREDDLEPESDPVSEDKTPKKHSHPPKHPRITCGASSAGNDGDDKEEHVIAPTASGNLKKHGRPFKVVDLDSGLAWEESFSVPVYVEIAIPPKLKPGKTYKGNKMEKQEPRMEGPFTLTRNML